MIKLVEYSDSSQDSDSELSDSHSPQDITTKDKPQNTKNPFGTWLLHVFIKVQPTPKFVEIAESICRETTNFYSNLETPISLNKIYHKNSDISTADTETDIHSSPHFFGGIDDRFDAQELHVSLSKPVYIKSHYIDNFLSCLEKRIKLIPSFEFWLGNLIGLSNDDGTRSFLAACVLGNSEKMLKLLSVVNQTMLDFSIPEFYECPKLHTSFASCEGTYLSDHRLLTHLKSTFKILNSPIQLCNIDSVKIKIGNRDFEIELDY